MTERRDFFVSYTGADRGWAEWISWQLEAAEYSVLLQAWDMVPGSNWLRMMHQATKFAERTIAVLSQDFLDSSEFGEAEWLAAYHRDPAGLAGRVIPVRVQDCTPDGLLAGIVYADLVGLDKPAAQQALLEAVRAALARRAKPLFEPAFPGTVPVPEPMPQPAPEQSPMPPARSDYLAQVRQIAPRELIERGGELAAMSAFSTDAAAGSYVWWRAAAWTGKTALMASWVLHPPPGVRVVSFFITARYVGNSDRAAYVEVVNEQLATLLGQSLPAFLSPDRQERWYWSLLTQAAEHCRRAGQRLILVVDGLDEDRGVTAGDRARSIAGLLPVSPPAGLRVIVAGRPDPALPADVPARHPLRDPEAVWLLRRSKFAEAVRADMMADLAHLRDGGPVGADVLGLVTAAGGGLSSRDLAELSAAATEWDVDGLLATVVGRSFTSHDRYWARTGSRVYVLGHEEIQQEAIRSYGPDRLAGYRERLHGWARTYRDRRWPADTPEYLLRGYFRLLLRDGDLGRVVDCATDSTRHDRMLDLSGGDTAALAEITEAQNAILNQPAPDLRAMARLAVHRGRIAERNANIPAGLPSVWARLGQPDRAEQLAHALTNPGDRVTALSGLARTLHRMGHHDRAQTLLDRAGAVARTITDRFGLITRDRALSSLAGARAQAGDHDQAARIARTITDPGSQVAALRSLAAAQLQSGDHGRARALAGEAERVARDITDPRITARVLQSVVTLHAEAGDQERARALADEAERVARAITEPGVRVFSLSHLASAHAEAGDQVRARTLTDEAERVARTITDPGSRARALRNVAVTHVEAGNHEQARTLAGETELLTGTVTDPGAQADALGSVAAVHARAGDHDRAERIALSITEPGASARALGTLVTAYAQAGDRERAERIAHTIAPADARAGALSEVAVAYAQAGDHDPAERVARAITDPRTQAYTLSQVAASVAAGDHDRAHTLADEAERLARTITDPGTRSRALRKLATAHTEAGRHDQAHTLIGEAERLARTVTDPDAQAHALRNLATTHTEADRHDQAHTLIDEAERLVATIIEPVIQAEALHSVARARAQAGQHDQALRTARTITNSEMRDVALNTVAIAYAEAGDHDQAERVARSIASPSRRVYALSRLAVTNAEAGDNERAGTVAGEAERIARTITNPGTQVFALRNVISAQAQAGAHDQVRALAAEAERVARAIPQPSLQAHALTSAAGGYAEVGDHERAASVIRSIADPGTQVFALQELVTIHAEAGDQQRARALADEAERLVRTVTDPATRSGLLSSVATAYTRAGAPDQAERVARAIANPVARDDVLADLTTAYATAGDHDQAERVARTVTDPDLQAVALSSVAVARARAGDRDEARDLLAHALAAGDWHDLPLVDLAGFAPDVLDQLAESTRARDVRK